MKFALALALAFACYGQGEITVVTFISARCPISNTYNLRMQALYRDYSAKGVKFRFINANANEPDEEVATHAKQAGYPFPVERDPNDLAGQFGADMTPTTYVLDQAGAIRYRGAIDDAQNEARVKHRYLRDALDAMLAGRPVAVAETKAFGCTIKRAAGPRPIDETGYAKLVAASKGRVLLVDFWATWCDPCREELPRLAALAGQLNFTLATISADEPDHQRAALALLDKERIPGLRFIKAVADDQAFINSIDKNWSGAIPALFLYDKSGRRAASFVGNFAMGDVEKAIRSLSK